MFLPVVARGGALLGMDGDLAAHIAYGRHLIDHGFPDHDPTVYTAVGAPVLQEWGAEVLMALAYGAFGWVPFVVGAAAVAATVPTALYVRAVREGLGRGVAAFSLAAVGAVTQPRPAMVTWALTALVLSIRLSPLGVLVLAAVWANLHGGVLVLPVALALRRDWRGLVAAGIGMQLNPWGPALWAHVLGFLAEANPAADFAPVWSGPLVWLYVPLAVAAIGVSVLRRDPLPALAALAAGTSARHLPLLTVILAVTLPGVLPRAVPRREVVAPLVLAVAGGLAVALALPAPAPRGPAVPWAAIEQVEQMDGRGFVGWDYGGYVCLLTGRRVWMHSLNANVPGWTDIVAPDAEDLVEEGIAWALADPGSGIHDGLVAAGWVPHWSNGRTAILVPAVR